MVCAELSHGQSCSHSQDPTYYSQRNYIVRRVYITSPFDFIAAIRRNEKEAAEHLPLRHGVMFQNSSYSQGIGVIKPFFMFSGIPSPLKLRVIIPALRNCDESKSRQLDVVYRVFLSNPLDYLHHPAEFTQSQIVQPATTAARANSDGRIAPSLAATYNRTTGLSGGGSVKIIFPDSWGSVGVSALESGAAHYENLGWNTSKQFAQSKLETLSVKIGYQHSDQPVDNGRLKFAHLFAQTYANTKEFTSKHLAFRYGAAVEGGYEQSGGILTTVIPSVVASDSYGSLKAYSGINLSPGSCTISASYAFQAGTNGDFTDITLFKHIGYASLMAQIPISHLEHPGSVHRPLNLEWELAGGFLQHEGTMPVSQRFFGGNAPQQFTEGEDWKIPSGPFIRAIPENRLNSSSVFGTPVGGSSFWSSNMTLSVPVWGYPLIPKDLARDPSFEPAIAAEREAAENALMLTYQKDLPAFKALVSRLPELDAELSRLQSDMGAMETRVPPEAASSFRASKSATDSAARVSKDVQTTTPQAASALIAGPISRLTKLSRSLGVFANALNNASDADDTSIIQSHRNRVLALQASLANDLLKVDLTVPKKRAADDLSVVDPVLNSILHRLNIVSISPLLIFDVARLWPDAAGTRFGPGAGARFTLVTFDVTLGYAWNVHGVKSEGPGAMFFSLDVSNIFR
jgi:hypothetical protein